MASCGSACAKYLLCFINFIFFAAGGAVLAVSIWLAVDSTSFLLLTKITHNESIQQFNLPTVVETGAYFLIAAGGLVFLIGFLGCCGAAMESRALLTMYGLLIIILFCLEVTAGVLAAIYKTQAQSEVQNMLEMSLKNYYSSTDKANSMTVGWNALMVELKCCGVNNSTDFEKANRWKDNKTSDMVIPLACCMLDGPYKEGTPKDADCTTNPSIENSYYLTGCLSRLQEQSFYYLSPMLSVAIALGTLQLILITLSFYLCRAIGKELKDVMDD